MGFLSTLFTFVLCFLSLSPISLALTNNTTSFHQHPRCHPFEGFALLKLKSSFSIDSAANADNHYLTTWNESIDCCSWSGITCDGSTGHVIGLDLSQNALRGVIGSNNSIFLLRHLKTLNLSHNDFQGSFISPEFGHFSKLTHLDLSSSNFRGPVPFEITKLSRLVSLQILQFYGNKTTIGTATFKALAQNLTNLRELGLAGVDLSSVPPILLSNFSSLTFLKLIFCNLSGELPESIFRLPNLKSLVLTANEKLTGSFPKSNWTTPLEKLCLSATRFSVNLTHLLNNAKSLSSLYLNRCNFVGSYPLLGANLSQISMLVLTGNMLSGQIPWSSLNVDKLSYLDLSFNNFTGQLPEAYANSTHLTSPYRFSHLTFLKLSYNFLDGPIPSWVYALPNLQSLELDNNAFIGNVVLKEFEKPKNLTTLNLSSNKLSLRFNNSIDYDFEGLTVLGLSSCNISEFPNFIRFSKLLKTLDLSQNRLQGNVPNWIGELSLDSLAVFNLSHNFLTSIEPSLPWKSLQVLDLRSNFFSGYLPILSSPLLTSLLLSKNRFTGPISTSFCNSPSLQLLDLSSNYLSGEIPPCLINRSENFTVLDLQRNRLRGNIPGTFPMRNRLKSLNLNGNMLQGPVPTSLVRCTDLKLLDLGNNLLNGTFPDWLQRLTKLQVLVLRSNEFRGSIPNPESKYSFSELRVVDLSTNKFSGALPAKLLQNFKAMMREENIKMEYMGEYYYQDSMPETIKGMCIVLERIQSILAIVDFSSNNFTGDIPDFIGSLISLNGLNLSHNMLEGTIPSSLGNLTNLEWLDLSHNGLVGNIPVELVNLKWLACFNLSNNKLQGPIPCGKQFQTFNNNSYGENSGLCGFPLSRTCENDGEGQDQGGAEEDENSTVLDLEVVMMGYASGVVAGLSLGYMLFFSRTTSFDRWFKSRFGRKSRRIAIAPLTS